MSLLLPHHHIVLQTQWRLTNVRLVEMRPPQLQPLRRSISIHRRWCLIGCPVLSNSTLPLQHFKSNSGTSRETDSTIKHISGMFHLVGNMTGMSYTYLLSHDRHTETRSSTKSNTRLHICSWLPLPRTPPMHPLQVTVTSRACSFKEPIVSPMMPG